MSLRINQSAYALVYRGSRQIANTMEEDMIHVDLQGLRRMIRVWSPVMKWPLDRMMIVKIMITQTEVVDDHVK